MKQITEKKLGITGDYQFKAIRSRNFLQANWHSNKLYVLETLLGKYKPETVLDLGTGSGNFELQFAGKLKRIIGVDYNDEALAFLKQKLKSKKITNVKLVHQDLLKTERVLKLGKFDMIILIDVIEHLEEKKSKRLISGMKKLLTKNGKVVIVTPNYGGLWPAIEKLLDSFTNIPHLENMQHVTKYTQKKLEKTFREAGYHTVKSSTFNTFSFILPDKKLSAAVCTLELGLGFGFGNLILSVFEPR